MEHITEDDLFDLAHARRSLSAAPELEAHLANCAACSALLCTLLDAPAGADSAASAAGADSAAGAAGAAGADSPSGAAARRDLAGSTLGPYRLEGLIGAGAMGEVYRGWDLRLQRGVAVKVLSRQLAGSPDRVRRLQAEARAAAAVAHPNVVTVYDTGEHDGVPFIVSELISGESLRSVIDRGPIARRTALELSLQLARGLAAAHAQGVVHRDLKPENLIVTDDGTLKILDFGLAKVSGERDAEATEPGTLLGTSGYLSPEQARGEPADARSDLFAVGAIAYELLSGRRAFGGATFAERLSGVLRDTPAPIGDPADAIVLRCLEKDPRKRFQSAHDLAWALEAELRGAAPAPAPAPALTLAPAPVAPAPAPDTPPAPLMRGVSRRTFVLGTAATGAGGLAAGLLLGRAWRALPRPAFVPEYRQLTFRQGRVANARFLPDGGSILYAAAWEELPLAIYTARLGGGGTRSLQLPPAQLLAVSSRGELALSLNHRFVEGFHQSGQLALAPLEGGEPRRLGLEAQHADFTPDGAELAIIRQVDARFRLELPAGRVLLEAGWISHPRISPDGALIACFVHDGPGDDGGDLVLVPRAGGSARTVAAGFSSIDGVAWAPGGRALWISASRGGGNNSVRAIALDGRELSHVPAAGRLRVHDVAVDGRLAVTHVSGRLRMMGKAPGAAGELELGLSDVSLVTDISSDGTSVVFAEFGDVDTANGAYLRPTGGGPALRLGEGTPIDLADDGRGVLAVLAGAPPALAVFPVPEGQPRPLPLPAALSRVHWARWASGDRILVAGAAAGRRDRLWRLDPDQALTPLTDEGVLGSCVVSHDGRRVATIIGGRLLVIDVDRAAASPAAPHVVPGSFADSLVCGWSAGAADVFVRTRSPPVRIRRVSSATGASAFVADVAPPRLGLRGLYTLVISEAGDAYAYSYGQELSRLYTMTTEAPST
jgi:eukaryotic-like serine/threonine-protein kinase